MSTNVVDLTAAVKTTLGRCAAIKAVYDYAPSNPSGYPFAIVRSTGWDNDRVSETYYRRIHHIRILLFQEISEVGFSSSKAARVFREAQDEIISEFDGDISLGGTCIMVVAERGTEPMLISEPVTALMMEIPIDCHIKIPRTSYP